MVSKKILASALLIASGHALSLNLVSNGNFQTGSLSSWTVDTGVVQVDTTSPNYYAVLGSVSSSYAFQLSQLVITAPSNSPYTFSFDWAPTLSSSVQRLGVSVNTQTGTVFNTILASTPSQSPALARYTFSFVTTALPFQISFVNATTGPAVAQMLDNVSVVPEPAPAILAAAGVALLVVIRGKQRQSKPVASRIDA